MVNYVFTLENFEYFLLILVRVTCFVYVAPLLGQQGIPNQIKIGFSFFVSLLLYNVVDRPELTYASVVGYAVVVIKEGITGLLIGYAASICNSIVLFAGNIIDMDIGLSMSTEFNQDMGTETTLTGNLYYYLVLLLLITSDFYTYLVRAVTDSFSVIPIAHQKFAWDHLLSAITRYMGDSFIIGFRIFSSVFCLHYGFELCTWNYGTCGTADEYVFDRYAAEDSGWICCFVSDRVPVAECGKLYF